MRRNEWMNTHDHIDVSHDNPNEKKPILVVPRRLTKIAYSIALKNDLVPRKWHLEGQHGSRTHAVGESMGFPLISTDFTMDLIVKSQPLYFEENLISYLPTNDINESSSMHDLLRVNGAKVIYDVIDPTHVKVPKMEHIDATFHSEKKGKAPLFAVSFLKLLDDINACENDKTKLIVPEPENINFTFAELFAGIGGFGVALESLGGKCVFASEISKACVKTYERNVKSLPANGVSGDIWTIKGKDIPHHDLLVGGFPCQSFSSLGDQPGLLDDKKRPSKLSEKTHVNVSENDHHVIDPNIGGRGQLYTQIVRVLKECKPKAFILENVQGLLYTDNGEALGTIIHDLEGAGYIVSKEVCSSRCLTAQSRKRLFIVGLLLEEMETPYAPFEFPFIPDLGLRAQDILLDETEVLCASNEIVTPNSHLQRNKESENNDVHSPTIFHVTDQQMHQLRNRSKAWKPAKLAWNEKVCDTIDSHYGNSVGKGHSQLVPCKAPIYPRRFTPRECARLMGFGESFMIEKRNSGIENKNNNDDDENKRLQQGPLAYIKEQYRMFGNAVCPPVIAALAGAVLARCENIQGYSNHDDWVEFGRMTGCRLAFDSISPRQRATVRDRLSIS